MKRSQRNTSIRSPKAIDRSNNSKASKFPVFTPKTENQEYFVESLDSDVIVVGAGYAGTGKAQPLYSKILTDVGFVEMKDIKVGDTVRSKDNWTTVTGVFPQGEKKVVRFKFRDGSTVECCVEHLWTVYNGKGHGTSKLETLPASEIITLLDSGLVGNVSIPVVGCIEYPEKDLPVDPYVLGAFLGDGHMTSSSPSLTSADPEMFRNVLECLGSDFKFTDNDSITKYLSDSRSTYNVKNRLKESFEKLGLSECVSNSKFIPEDYMTCSEDQRYSLLQGLLDTDGTVDHRTGSVSFCSVSKNLAYSVREVVLSLGGKASVRSRIPTYTYKGEKKNGQLAYNVHISVLDKRRLFRLERKKVLVSNTDLKQLRRVFESYEYIGEVDCQCISVQDPTHLYVTDDYILTHNTILGCYHAASKLYHGKIKKIILLRAYQPLAGRTIGFTPGEAIDKLLPHYQQMVDYLEDFLGKAQVGLHMKSGAIEICSLETIRGRSWEDCVVIVDESQNLYIEEVQALTTRVGSNCQLILIGDDSGIQTDVVDKKNGLSYLLDIVEKYDIPQVGITYFHIEDILRSGVVKQFVIAYDKELQCSKGRNNK